MDLYFFSSCQSICVMSNVNSCFKSIYYPDASSIAVQWFKYPNYTHSSKYWYCYNQMMGSNKY